MPVSFSPSTVVPKSIKIGDTLTNATPTMLLSGVVQDYDPKKDMFQSSFPTTSSDIICVENGLVHTVTEAYNSHHALIIRPDDVWLAILVQFSFFVNGNAELLRSQFVAHEGKKELVVTAVGTRFTVDFGHMAKSMADEIQKNVVDPNLRAWIMPDFSTTTTNDTIVCAIAMMATLNEYFSYKFELMCGIPRVTLEGTKKDWENILKRLERLKQCGVQSIAWYHLLFPVISRFVKAFDDPDGKANIDFWGKVAHYEGGGSGPTWLSGWITAFCVFDAQGKWLGNRFIEHPKTTIDPVSLSAAKFFTTYLKPGPVNKILILDGAIYHRVDTLSIPVGYAEADVNLDDNGVKFDCVLVSGLVGKRVHDSKGTKEGTLSGSGLRDVVSPVAGWWMFEKSVKDG